MKAARTDRLLVGIALLTAVFIGELVTSFRGVEALLYGIVTLYVLTTDQSPRYRRDSIVLGILATLFMIIGMVLHPDDYALEHLLSDHMLGILAVWTIVIFSIRYKHVSFEETKQKEQLNALFNNATEGILFVDHEGKIIRINSRAERMFGYEPGVLVGSPVHLLIPNRLIEKHNTHIRNFFRSPFSKTMTSKPGLEGRRKDGSEFPLDLSLNYFKSNEVTIAIVFLVDITERKLQETIISDTLEKIRRLNEELESQVASRTAELTRALSQLEKINASLEDQITVRQEAEEKLRKTQRMYEVMAHNFPDGIISVFDRSLTCIFIEGREISGLGINPEVNGNAPILLPEPFRSRLTPYLSKALQGEAICFEMSLAANFYHVSAVPIHDRSEAVQELLVVIRNITERKNMERNLLKALDKEKELNILKSRFVTMASHEFRTPLSTISTSLFLLENYTGPDYQEEKRKHVDRIKRSVRHLTEVLNDFLNLGKLEEGKIKPSFAFVDLPALLDELMEEMEMVKKHGQRINLSLQADAGTIFTDANLLKGILINLLSNAIKYSGPDEEIDLDISHDNEFLHILVADKGIGIPDDEKKHIFKRFYRAVNATYIPGTGLGLNIVKKYLRLVNGTIEFESEVDKGTTFIVTIPHEASGKSVAEHSLNTRNPITHE